MATGNLKVEINVEDGIEIDWDNPLMLQDDPYRVVIHLGAAHGGDHNVSISDHNRPSSRITAKGAHVRYDGEIRRGRVMNRPAIQWNLPLTFLDNDDFGHMVNRIQETESIAQFGTPTQINVPVGEAKIIVDDNKGTHYEFREDGTPIGHKRAIANESSAQTAARAMVAIKKSQRERSRNREQEKLDALEEANPGVFGSF